MLTMERNTLTRLPLMSSTSSSHTITSRKHTIERRRRTTTLNMTQNHRPHIMA